MRLIVFVGLLAGLLAACRTEEQRLYERARELTQRFILIDGHIDVPYRLRQFPEDITRRTELGDFDYERARAGGWTPRFSPSTCRPSCRTRPAHPKRWPIR
nr:dipeptidase [Rhodothermus marinus]